VIALLACWMAVWWLTEAITVYATALLPVATPPNAIVYGSGLITTPAMARAGVWLNLAGAVLITLITSATLKLLT